jgi:FixJ family two-component response regulator
MGMQARTIAVVDDDLRVLESLINLLAVCKRALASSLGWRRGR